MSTQLVAAVATFGLIGAGLAGATETRAADAIPGASAVPTSSERNRCRVELVRSGAAGSAAIARQVLDSGRCVCIVTTGPVQTNGAAENIVKALLRERTCDGAPLVSALGANSGVDGVVSSAETGGTGAMLPALIGGVGASGLAVALGSSSKG